MIIIPAIDLLEGRCVRLSQGSYSEVSVYSDDPVATAEQFAAAGARRIHLVDLDAARGSGNNRKIIAKIRAAVPVTIEAGGGVRSHRDVEELLSSGVDRIIVGTVLARDPRLVSRWCSEHPGVFLAGIDAREGRVMVAGWQAGTALIDTDLARQARELGCCGIIYTSIARDGMLAGPDLDRTNAVAEGAGLPVLLSGGVSSISDVERAVESGHPNLRGVIVGKALYAGRVTLADAIRAAGDQFSDGEDESW